MCGERRPAGVDRAVRLVRIRVGDVGTADDAPGRDDSIGSGTVVHSDSLAPVRVGRPVAGHVDDNLTGRGYTIAEPRARIAGHQVDVTVCVHPAAEVERRAGVMLLRIVVEDAELEDRNSVIVERSGKPDLGIRRSECRRVHAPSFTKRNKAGERRAHVDGRLLGRLTGVLALKILVDEEIREARRNVGLDVRDVDGRRRDPDVEHVAEVARHVVETGLRREIRVRVGLVVRHHQRLVRYARDRRRDEDRKQRHDHHGDDDRSAALGRSAASRTGLSGGFRVRLHFTFSTSRAAH